mmetsp:Transcript_2334/g.4285  ORF Transcript_2334/g.4285 Transcript_2334/m.4285 type:complete len:119 (-) Transcript_2334:312-668(-)
MCKHVLNCEVYMQSPCCQKWFECAECHDDNCNHPFKFATELRFCCKRCKTCFNRNFKFFSEKDKHCSVCGVQWVMAAVTPESKLIGESMQLLESYMDEIVDSNNDYFHTIEEVEQQLV